MRVVLVGGFACPPSMLRPLAGALRGDGHSATIAPFGLNVGCGERTAARLAALVTTSTDPVALVGHSRGGQLARVVAARHPEAVDRLVTVATPWTVGPPEIPGVQAAAVMIRASQRLGIDVMPSINCATGACCRDFRSDLDRKPDVPWTALWSRRDRVAGAHGQPPPDADAVIDTGLGHVSAVISAAGIAHVLDALTAGRRR